MRMTNKALTAFPALLAVLSCASIAFACTGQTRILSITPQAAASGAHITVKGNGIATGTPVQVRWNSVTGAALASATTDEAGAFSVTVTVPQADPGIYYLVIGSGSEGVGRSAFEVTAPSTERQSNAASADAAGKAGPNVDLWQGFASKAPEPAGGVSLAEPTSAGRNGMTGVGALLASLGGAVLALIGISSLHRTKAQG